MPAFRILFPPSIDYFLGTPILKQLTYDVIPLLGVRLQTIMDCCSSSHNGECCRTPKMVIEMVVGHTVARLFGAVATYFATDRRGTSTQVICNFSETATLRQQIL